MTRGLAHSMDQMLSVNEELQGLRSYDSLIFQTGMGLTLDNLNKPAMKDSKDELFTSFANWHIFHPCRFSF